MTPARYTEEDLRTLMGALVRLVEEATKLLKEERERRAKRDRA